MLIEENKLPPSDMGVLFAPFLRVSPKIVPPERDPPFLGKPSALGHEGVRGRRLRGAAMLCRLQCAREAIRWRIADALYVCPRHSHGRRGAQEGFAL